MLKLSSIAAAIERRRKPLTVFFRDDDIGWANEKLAALCNRFAHFDAPLDLAVIPGSLDGDTANDVIRIIREYSQILGLHQHGYTHTNHQHSGRKCEFGNSRSFEEKSRDIALGRERLHKILGELIDPIFTPPWNRCTADTCEILVEQEFLALSRIAGSEEIEHSGLVDISATLDWNKWQLIGSVNPTSGGDRVTKGFEQLETVGVMLHHEQLTEPDLDRLSAFIELLKNSERVEFRPMMQLCESIARTKEGCDNDLV